MKPAVGEECIENLKILREQRMILVADFNARVVTLGVKLGSPGDSHRLPEGRRES